MGWSQLERVLLRSGQQDTEVFVQVFDENGTATSPKIRVGESQNNDLNLNASIVALEDGGFIVFYDKNRHEPSLNGQRYDADGTALGEEFRVFDGAVGNIDTTLLSDNRVALSFETDDGLRTETLDVDEILRFDEGAVSIVGTEEDDILEGGPGNDRFDGLDGDDLIFGGSGADRIDGGAGFDTVTYAASEAAVEVALNIGSALQSGGDAEGDILHTIENVTGSDFADTITGNDGVNVIQGLAGDDSIEGLGGADTISAGAGNDTAIVEDGANRRFDGGAGFDTLQVSDRVGLNGDDEVTNFEALEIIGTAGRNALLRLDADQAAFEKITYESQNGRAAVVEFFGDGSSVLDLSTAELIGFDTDDEFRFFGSDTDETVTGTVFDDRLEGRRGKDVLNGEDDVRAGSGDDEIFGGAGDDFLRGENGNDIINGGEGADTIEGGNGTDTVTYADSNAGVQVALNIGSARQSGGLAEGDILRTIENVTGSEFADAITGNDNTNYLVGGAGDDLLDGRGGRDIVEGGAGDDVIVAINSSFSQTYDGGTGDDTLRTIGRVELRTDVIVDIETLEIAAVKGQDALVRLDFSQ